MPKQSEWEYSYTITYEDVTVTDSQLRMLKKAQKDAQGMVAYGRFKAWLHYANLQSWQQQGHHFQYLSGDNSVYCTCGLTLHENGRADEEVAVKVSEKVESRFVGLRLDQIHLARGHRNLPSLQGITVALTVDFIWDEEREIHLWDSICQQCGEVQVKTELAYAKAFVESHNYSCGKFVSDDEYLGDMGNLANIHCPVCRGVDISKRWNIGNGYYECNTCEARFKE